MFFCAPTLALINPSKSLYSWISRSSWIRSCSVRSIIVAGRTTLCCVGSVQLVHSGRADHTLAIIPVRRRCVFRGVEHNRVTSGDACSEVKGSTTHLTGKRNLTRLMSLPFPSSLLLFLFSFYFSNFEIRRNTNTNIHRNITNII